MNYLRKLTLAKRMEYPHTSIRDMASFSGAVWFNEISYYMIDPETGGGWCIAVLAPHSVQTLPPSWRP